jgi:hypothetical protein
MVHSYGMAYPEVVYEAARMRAEMGDAGDAGATGAHAQAYDGHYGGHHG